MVYATCLGRGKPDRDDRQRYQALGKGSAAKISFNFDVLCPSWDTGLIRLGDNGLKVVIPLWAVYQTRRIF